MATNSEIEWTDATWNPVTGCSKISPGCKHCYAARMANRLQAMGQANYSNGFDVTLQPKMLELPLQWKMPKRIFVNSMSDLFHPEVSLSYIKRVFAVMHRAHWHQYQILTKRSERLLKLSGELDWAPQIWMGVSVESEKYVHRIDDLRKTDAQVKFLSLEPLLGPLPNFKLTIDWAIVGGELGAGCLADESVTGSPISATSAQSWRPVFLQAMGWRPYKRFGRTLEGRTWDQMQASRGLVVRHG